MVTYWRRAFCAATHTGAPITLSTYYDAVARGPSARAVRDEQLKPAIRKVHGANYGVHGARKVRLALNCEGTGVARSRWSGSGVSARVRANSPTGREFFLASATFAAPEQSVTLVPRPARRWPLLCAAHELAAWAVSGGPERTGWA